MQNKILSVNSSFTHKLNNINKIDFTFLQSFKRSSIDYATSLDPVLVAAYQSGIYDTMLSILGDSNLKITGTSRTTDEVKKFLRQMSFNAELILIDDHYQQIKTISEQEALAEYWMNENRDQFQYTQFVLMIPKDNDREKLAAIVRDFLTTTFNDCRYLFVEHTDTDIFHYHVIVEKALRGELLEKIQSDFIAVCIKHETRLL